MKKAAYGYKIIKCMLENAYTGKIRKIWMLCNPDNEAEEIGFSSYHEALNFAKTHPITRR